MKWRFSEGLLNAGEDDGVKLEKDRWLVVEEVVLLVFLSLLDSSEFSVMDCEFFCKKNYAGIQCYAGYI